MESPRTTAPTREESVAFYQRVIKAYRREKKPIFPDVKFNEWTEVSAPHRQLLAALYMRMRVLVPTLPPAKLVEQFRSAMIKGGDGELAERCATLAPLQASFEEPGLDNRYLTHGYTPDGIWSPIYEDKADAIARKAQDRRPDYIVRVVRVAEGWAVESRRNSLYVLWDQIVGFGKSAFYLGYGFVILLVCSIPVALVMNSCRSSSSGEEQECYTDYDLRGGGTTYCE